MTRSTTRPLHRILTTLPCLAVLLLATAPLLHASEAQDTTPSDQSALTQSRKYYLNDLISPHTYTPGKNSFLFQILHKGQRKTVLNLTGSGSVRHLWSTWSIPGSDAVPAGRILLRIYVDGQTTPSIVGTIDELCHAAEATGTSFVPLPAFIYKDAYNFYLPIYFSNGIRVEIEALDEVNEFYTQIDYRLDPHQKHSTRLLSHPTKNGLALNYTGTIPSLVNRTLAATKASDEHTDLQCNSEANHCEATIQGPGILRRLTFRGKLDSPDLQMDIYWDDDPNPAIQAPLRYFFADFVNAAMESKSGESTTYFPMPFHRKARIVLRSASPIYVSIDYAIDRSTVSPNAPYFHALYHETQKALGYSQHPVLQVRGKGLFVGMNLFDSGHNHGGGDAALLDAGTDHPTVLHGICGEDYFGFAWHHTGTMTPLTGAPVHERRYRLHLENPYPFSESFQFLFGVFAGMTPKSVAFWYQFPTTPQPARWIGVDAPWKVLGPLGPETSLPDTVDDRTYKTNVAINQPTELQERWQNVQMTSGFLDLTYQFRHYALIESGSGFVAGVSRTKLTTYIDSPSKKSVDVTLGHDDEVTLQLNDNAPIHLPSRSGLGPTRISLPLHSGWNKLSLVLSNDENVNWRWSGVSLALRKDQSHGLRFSSHLPSSTTEH